jgi:hypothetical protein
MITTDFSQIPVGDPGVWDFSMRYNLWMMTEDELEVLRIKYELLVKRNKGDEKLFWQIQEILGKIYREVMNRNMKKQIEIIETKNAV